MNKSAIPICILAGGKSTRISVDKSNLLLKDRNLLDNAIQIGMMTGRKIYVSSGKRDMELDGVEIVKDIQGEGPIAGLMACLVKNKKILMFPCDMPFLTPGFLAALEEQSSNFDITVCRIDKRLQPQVGIYSDRCLPLIKLAIEQKNYSLHNLVHEKTFKVNIVEEEQVGKFGSPSRLFHNINTMADLKAARKML